MEKMNLISIVYFIYFLLIINFIHFINYFFINYLIVFYSCYFLNFAIRVTFSTIPYICRIELLMSNPFVFKYK